MTASLGIAIGFALVWGSYGKIYTRCELAKELMNYPLFQTQINDWVCLVEKESSLDSNAVGGPNSDGSMDYGLFQLNDKYWCGANGAGGSCNIDCQTLLGDNAVAGAADCVKKVYDAMGLPAWYGWQKGCMGQPLPDIKSECGL